MRKIFIIIFIISTVSCSSLLEVHKKQKTFLKSTYKNVKIYESDGFGLGPCEPSIFINPTNTNNMVAGSVLNNYHFSFDGGLTWETQKLQSDLGVFGDPCIVADNQGNFYYLHLSDPDKIGWKSPNILDQIVVQKSVDGGKNWSSGTGIGKNSPKQQDKEWAVINPLNNEIYVTWTEFDKYGSKNTSDKSRILFSKSVDGGNSFSDPINLSQLEGNCMDDDLTTEGAVPSVGVNGEIYVAWSFNQQIYFDKSVDNGQNWLAEDVIITSQNGGWKTEIPGIGRSNGMPVTAVDHSNSKHRGTIYVNWTDVRNGINNTDVFIAKSKNNGKTWSKPKKVNTDKSVSHQFLTWMSVDPKTGFIYIVYYDRHQLNNNKTDVSLAVSYNGGKKFVSKKISENPFSALPKEVFFGDYNNINALNGVIRPVWTHYENEKLSIFTAIINE
ncbi:MAG: sialidase family protein [Flavobacteriaceae bacterium]|nr:sialidase family protein [Flavobacteriaceae bacterium]